MIRQNDRVVHVDDDDASLVGVVVKADSTLAHVVWAKIAMSMSTVKTT